MTRHQPKRKRRMWPGVKQAACALGVSYEHLRMCLMGVRQSRRLMARYVELKGQQEQAAATKE